MLLKTKNEDIIQLCQNQHVQVIILDLLQDGMNKIANNRYRTQLQGVSLMDILLK